MTTLKNIITLGVMLAIGCMFWFALAASGQEPTRQDLERMQQYQHMIDVDQAFQERLQHEQHMRLLEQQPNTMELPVCPASPTGDCFYRGEEYFR